MTPLSLILLSILSILVGWVTAAWLVIVGITGFGAAIIWGIVEFFQD